MYLVELVPITQRATRYVDRMARVIVHGENYTVAGVGQHTTYPVLVHVKGLQVRVEEEPGRFQVHRRLTSALVAQPPIRIDQTPEPGTFEPRDRLNETRAIFERFSTLTGKNQRIEDRERLDLCGVGEKLDVFGKHWRKDNSYELVSICEKKCVIRHVLESLGIQTSWQ